MDKRNKEENYNISDTGNWNVAAEFSRLKVMKPLYLSDVYEDVAKFGFSSFIDELSNFNIPLDQLKIKGLERLLDELVKLIKNCKFAMKKPGTLESIETLEKHLESVKKLIPGIYNIITKQKTRIIKIIPDKYNRVLNLLLEIKSKINEPLNQNHLIFTDKESFDPQAYKKMVKDLAISRG